MKLSLSVRVAEAFRNKREVNIELEDLAHVAKNAGYEALCMRASMAGTHSPPERIAGVKAILRNTNLYVSMATADFAIPENGPEGPTSLRNITPHLDLAEALGCDLLRICMKEEKDIPFAQQASDEAAERGIRLAHQSHTRSLFETVTGSLDTLKKVNRSNFGIIYEPANLALCGEDYGPETIRAYEPHLFNVYLQNHIPNSNGDTPMDTWALGRIQSSIYPLDDERGLDFNSVFDGLRSIDYQGYVTVHQAFGGDLPPEEASIRSANYLKSLID